MKGLWIWTSSFWDIAFWNFYNLKKKIKFFKYSNCHIFQTTIATRKTKAFLESPSKFRSEKWSHGTDEGNLIFRFFSIFEKWSDFAKILWARAQLECKHSTKISLKLVAYFWFGGYFNIIFTWYFWKSLGVRLTVFL